jgi:hypothetical protein
MAFLLLREREAEIGRHHVKTGADLIGTQDGRTEDISRYELSAHDAQDYRDTYAADNAERSR